MERTNGVPSPLAGFFGPLFDWADGGDDEGLRQLLQGPKLTGASEDDKTLVIVKLPVASGEDHG
jgi:hypothetical protein